MATTQSSTPSFRFLKEGVLLPWRNRRLFTAALALMVASNWLLSLTSELTLKRLHPITEEIHHLNDEALMGGDPSIPAEHAKHMEKIQHASWKLILASAPNLLLAATASSTVQIVTHFVAVTTCSGDVCGFGVLVGRAKAQLMGPLVTLVLAFVMKVADVTLLLGIGATLRFLLGKHNYVMLLMASAVALPVAFFLVVFSFLCSLSVVVAVAERRCKGASAILRAWQLLNGKRWPAVIFAILVFYALPFAAWPLGMVAGRWVPNSVVAGLPFRVARSILTEAASLFGVYVMTAFYYECKESKAVMVTDDRNA